MQVRAVTEAALAAAARDAAQPPLTSSSAPAPPHLTEAASHQPSRNAVEDAAVAGSSGGSTAAERAEAGVKAQGSGVWAFGGRGEEVNLKPSTFQNLNLQPSILNPEPLTPNSEPSTLIPKP